VGGAAHGQVAGTFAAIRAAAFCVVPPQRQLRAVVSPHICSAAVTWRCDSCAYGLSLELLQAAITSAAAVKQAADRRDLCIALTFLIACNDSDHV
jgi:hypothetical protein